MTVKGKGKRQLHIPSLPPCVLVREVNTCKKVSLLSFLKMK